MKNIFDYIKESIMDDDNFDKKKVRDYADFIDYLGDLNDDEIDVLQRINKEIKEICSNKRIDYKYMFTCTELEGVVMLAAMLVDDNKPCDKVQSLGLKTYRGTNNPYDYSWFDGEDEDGVYTGLEIFQLWCEDNFEKFEIIYELVSRHKEELTVDWIWEEMREYM